MTDGAAAMCARSTRENSKQSVDHDNEHDTSDDRPGGRKTDGRSSRAGRQTSVATDCCDRKPENGGLDDAEDQIPCRHRSVELRVELQETDVESRHHQSATEYADDVGKY